MNRVRLVSVLIAAAILSADVAWAQTYPVIGGGTITQTGVSACASLSRDLSYGSRGSDVTTLQNFLVGQNYPGSGNWMITGYFGSATRQAVINFQGQQGIAQSGSVDVQTRVAIRNSTCGTTSSFTSFVTTPPLPTVSINTISIGSLSVSSGGVGTSVTIYGSGFDTNYNSVYFGNVPVTGTFASDGSSITFSVPVSTPSSTTNCGRFSCLSTQYIGAGTYPIFVTNARGISNSLPFTVVAGGPVGCAVYGTSGVCSYGFGSYNTYGSATINNMYPMSGAVGSSITVIGSGFSRRNNTIHFGSGVITGITSNDGNSLSFPVPSQLTGYGSQTLSLGVYGISVTNENGATSNTVPFTLTSLAGSGSNAVSPTIQNISGPTLLAAKTLGTWTITANNQSNLSAWVSVRWGDEGTAGTASYSQPIVTGGAQTMTFSHVYQTSGTYQVTFIATNSAGGQNTSGTIVTVTP